MPVRPVAFRSPRNLQIALLASVSALALVTAAAPAEARCIGVCAGGAMSATSAAASAAIVSAQQAAAATQQTMNSLTRATLAIQAMQAAQTAAHNLALAAPSGVPNGLAPGGLQVAPNAATDSAVWQGANLPTQSTSNGQTTVEIDQTQQKAILTWTTFNVGKNTQVYFNQSAGNTSAGNNWIVLNRVIDPSGQPSQILGSIKAEGTVYLINQNGIIFGGSSQVNVNSLLVSSLPFMGDPLNLRSLVPGSVAYDNAVNASAGQAQNPATPAGNGGNTNFLAYGIEGMGTQSLPSLGSLQAYRPADVASLGNVTVAPGALIEVGSLGYALLAAPYVTNAGAILAPNGQAILAAGTSMVLGTSTNGANPSLTVALTDYMSPGAHGVDGAPLFAATNTGLIEAATGNVTLAGGAVNQMGVVAVTTGISRPGSITISAVDELDNGTSFANAVRTGPVTFAAGSVTAILPAEDGETTTSTQAATAAFKAGSANITGGSVTFQSGSLLDAPGASVSVAAMPPPTPYVSQSPSDPTVNGRVYIDSGAVIDVAGLPNVTLPVADTLVTITKLTANDLADSPLDRNGFLISQTVVIDSTVSGVRADGEAWVGSPILDAQGYVGNVPRTIDQMLVNGGTINLAGNEIITAPGSVLNLMGGYIHYLGGTIATTRLIDAWGRIVDISQADPNIPIVGIAGQFVVDHAHWGVTQVYTNRLISGAYYQSDYIQGGNAGTLNILTAPGGIPFSPTGTSDAVILDGTILAGAEAGLHQVAGGTLPTGGTLYIGDPALVVLIAPGADLGVPVSSPGYVVTAQGEPFADLGLWPSQAAPPSLLVRGIIDQAFLDFLGQAGADYLNAASPNFGKIARAYEAIETLFPSHLGYTQNNDTGVGVEGAASRIQTGNLSLPRSVMETQEDSNINLIGPGGTILVGSNSLDALQTNQQGILTLGGGAINSFTDGSVIVNQSRIMTEQGGDIDLFSANADLSAGKGLKTKRSAPHFQITCSSYMFCFVNPSGLVTGSGIAALLTVPGQDPNKSNVQLVAPHGTVDIGAAGVRGTTVNVVAARILNAFNIQATTVVGLPTFTGPSVATLTTANSDAGSQQAKLPTMESKPSQQPSIVIVEFIGFGGDDKSDENKNSTVRPECPAGAERGASQTCGSGDRRSQNPNSPYQVLGAGDIADEQVMKMISQARGAAR